MIFSFQFLFLSAYFYLPGDHKAHLGILGNWVLLNLNALCNIFSRQQFEIFSLFFPEKYGDNLHETSNPVSWEKYFKMLPGENFTQGPVVQSVVSLTSSFRVISLTVLVDSIYNILILFAEKIWVAFALQKLLTFFQQKISAYLRITRCKFQRIVN